MNSVVHIHTTACIPFARHADGFTLIELLIALAISAILFAGLGGILGQTLNAREVIRDKNDLTQQANFAMQRMVQAVADTRLLLLPMNDKLLTNWAENIREETNPPTTTTDASAKYTAVLAVTLPAYRDLNGDGFPDADDDKDGRIDEDMSADMSNDEESGIWLIDDGGDGLVDEGSSGNDDEYSFVSDEDPINGIDDEDDNNLDDDAGADMNGDGCPGVCGVDEDGVGGVDEGAIDDDDEDGQSNEDWYNSVVFQLFNNTLLERIPVPWDENGSGSVTGRDFIMEPIAENVTLFRVERLPLNGGRYILVDLTLALTSPVTGETVSLNTRVRVGGAL